MKKIILFLVASLMLLSACQKSISDFDPSSTQGNGTGTGTTTPTTPASSGAFVAVVNGTKITFGITAATLVRSQAANEKRIDVTGTSTDGKTRLIITLGEETYQGNAITVKKYILNPFPDDDPSTPDIDESLYTQGFTTYGTASGGNWIYGVYSENGSFTVTNCDASRTVISGTFQTTLTDMNDSTNAVKITAGQLTNVKYTVIN